jgi:hypothetical protein
MPSARTGALVSPVDVSNSVPNSEQQQAGRCLLEALAPLCDAGLLQSNTVLVTSYTAHVWIPQVGSNGRHRMFVGQDCREYELQVLIGNRQVCSTPLSIPTDRSVANRNATA